MHEDINNTGKVKLQVSSKALGGGGGGKGSSEQQQCLKQGNQKESQGTDFHSSFSIRLHKAGVGLPPPQQLSSANKAMSAFLWLVL